VVVWKPSDDAPGTAALFFELLRRAGVPGGVLNIVHGGGAGGAGEHLIEAVDAGLVDKVSFTGSTAVGRKIGEVCGRRLQVPSLELGGKNPLVVWPTQIWNWQWKARCGPATAPPANAAPAPAISS
jgi:aldehyde dehydrogenase (NAD+)